MKASIRFFVVIFILNIQFLTAQVPNNSFENWTGGTPDGWFTPNVIGLATSITQSTTAQNGNSAVRGEVLDIFGQPYPAYVFAGLTGEGFPVNIRYESLKGWFQFTPVGGDYFFVYSVLYAGNTGIAAAEFNINTPVTSYTQFTALYQYFSNDIPDRCVIYIGAAGQDSINFTIGSNFLLDNLELTGSVAVSVSDENIVHTFKLAQNYPNPFNPSTKISYSIPQQSNVTLKIYDAVGNEVADLINEEKPAGNYTVDFKAAGLASGMYFYTLRAGALVETKKMILLR